MVVNINSIYVGFSRGLFDVRLELVDLGIPNLEK